MLRINFDFILWSNKKYISLFVLGTGQRIVGLPFLKKESTMNQTVDKLGLLNNGKEGERVALHGVLWPSWNPSNIETVGYRGVSGGPWNPLHCTAVMFEGFQECLGAPLYRTAVMFEEFQGGSINRAPISPRCVALSGRPMTKFPVVRTSGNFFYYRL